MPTLSVESSKAPTSFKGIYTALVTPFLPDGAIDWKSYEALLEAQLRGQVHGIVVCGTTAESPTLAIEEKRDLIKMAVQKCRSRAFVVAGTGSNDTMKTIRDSQAACQLGVDALLVVTPYYNKPSQAGLEAHFNTVANECSAPIVLYNVPGRTGVSLAATTVAKLARHPRIVGIKEATGNMALMSEMKVAVDTALAGTKRHFSFLSGDDVTFLPFLACGGDGIISVASNVLPNCMRMLFEDWMEGRVGSAQALHDKLTLFFNALFIEPNPVPTKAILSWNEKMGSNVRLPLVEMQPENAKKVKQVWDALLAHLKADRPREDIHG